MHPEFAPIAFISAFSLALPLPWHWRARNVATLSIMFWLFITNIIYGIDAIIWGDSIDIVATVWCDISTKLIIGSNIALPAACLCICIHLEAVASVRLARTSAADRKRRQIFEALMCFALPILYMHFGHRFDIIQEYGCRPTTYFSVASIFLVFLPPIILSVASLIIGGMHRPSPFHRSPHLLRRTPRRLPFRPDDIAIPPPHAHVHPRNALVHRRHLVHVMVHHHRVPLRPYTSWAGVHSNFSRIDTYPTLFIPDLVLRTYYFLWWLVPISTFAFVAMFAFGRDAVEEYKKCFLWVRRVVFRVSLTSSSDSKNGPGVSKFPGGISLASFDAKRSVPPTPSATAAANPLPRPGGPALSYHTHPADRSFEHEQFDFDTEPEPETPSSYALTSPSPSTLAHARAGPPGDLGLQFASPRPRNLTDASRPYTYPSLDASHHGLAV
ncbi:putative pheromone receptor [Mycena olivaceomarginata]|nr:putative pheromone receptor [Mycena olivaceomarginata]